jgi:hypothetical protein
MKCALRIIQFYSSEGDPNIFKIFEDKMRGMSWRSMYSIAPKESLKPNAIQIEPGTREHWHLAIRMYAPLIEACLNELQIQ